MYSRYTYEIVGGILIFISSLVGEQMPTRWKKTSYIVFGVLAIGYVLIGIALDRDSVRHQGEAEQTIKDLKDSVKQEQDQAKKDHDDSEQARQSDRDAFLKQFTSLSQQISDIRTNVQTESLRKQLDETQKAVADTQKALEAREVRLAVAINGQIRPTVVSLKRDSKIGDESYYSFEFALVNQSDQDAGAGVAEVQLQCFDCVGLRFIGKTAWDYWRHTLPYMVGTRFVEVPRHQGVLIGGLYFISDSRKYPKQVQVGFHYKCVSCVAEDWVPVTFNLE